VAANEARRRTSQVRMTAAFRHETAGLRHGSKNGRSGREGADRLCAAATVAAAAPGPPVSRHCSTCTSLSFRISFAVD
jgi:hypothetical protein